MVRFALMELMVKYLFSGHVFVVVTDPFDAVVSKRTDGFRVGFLDGPVLHSNLLADLVIGQIALLSGGFAWFGRAVSWAAQFGQIGVGQFVGSSVGRDAQDELVGRCSVEQVNLNGGVLNFVLKKNKVLVVIKEEEKSPFWGEKRLLTMLSSSLGSNSSSKLLRALRGAWWLTCGSNDEW